MKGVILGGGTFLGYWLKDKIISAGLPRPVLIDLPRRNRRVYITTKDTFYQLKEVDYQTINNHMPDYVILNYYDLLDTDSIEINKADNNIIMTVTNKLLDLAQERQCYIYVLTHVNRYPFSNDSYRTTFNNLNDLYLQYIELISRAKELRTKIFLLPNLFGPRESSSGVIPTIIKKITNGEKLELAKTARDFFYVHTAAGYIKDALFSKTFNDNQTIYFELSSGQKTYLSDMYKTICDILGKHTTMTLVDESYRLKKAEISSSKISKIIISQDYLRMISSYNKHFVP